ncbi:MAG: hypothetical protein AAF989_11390, partial [Planctomycetota bacterium]
MGIDTTSSVARWGFPSQVMSIHHAGVSAVVKPIANRFSFSCGRHFGIIPFHQNAVDFEVVTSMGNLERIDTFP